MSLILVDIGNSAIKLNFVSSDVAAAVGSPLDVSCKQLRVNDWSEFDFGQLPKAVCCWTISSVDRAKLNELSTILDQAGRPQDQIRSVRRDAVALEVDVDQPDAVGIDRLIGCLAVAQDLADDEAAVVVDAGTAVTIDLVTGAGVFRGGVIYPGANASFLQLNQQTAALPGLDYAQRKEMVAAWHAMDAKADGKSADSLMPWQRSTAAAIVTGVYRTQLAGLAQTVTQFRDALPEPLSGNCRIVLTGGGIDELLAAGKVLNCQPSWIDQAAIVPNLIHDGLLSIHHRQLSGA